MGVVPKRHGSIHNALLHACVCSSTSPLTFLPSLLLSSRLQYSFSFYSNFCFRCCRDEKNEHHRHTYQHIVQLIYEIILFVFALTEHKYIELLAIVAGLSLLLSSSSTPLLLFSLTFFIEGVVGSVMGIARLFIIDTVLNTFALVTGIFLLGNTTLTVR